MALLSQLSSTFSRNPFTLDEFISQLSIEDLSHIVKGQGMHSPAVTSGTAGAFGGITDRLRELGIKTICTADGPSGIRMDTGEKTTLIANGTCLASSWNDEL